MSDTLNVRERTTNEIVMQLLSDGSAIDLTSVDHIRLDMIDSLGNTYQYSSDDSTPHFTITNASTGLVTFSPPSDETVFLYQRGPYKMYIKIFLTSTISYTCPENEASVINVTKEY